MRVAVVGSGMGGLCIALLLKAEGIDSTIYEKAAFAGGSFTSKREKGYTLDTGLHVLARGRSGELPVLMRNCIGGDVFEKNFVEQKPMVLHYKNRVAPLPKEPLGLALFRPLSAVDRVGFARMFLHFCKIGYEGTWRYQGAKTADFVKKYVRSEDGLRVLNALCWMTAGQSINEAPLVRFIQTFITKTKRPKVKEPMYYPRGGLAAIVGLFLAQGLEVKTGHEVEKIVVKNGRVIGVRVNGGVVHCDVVVYGGELNKLNEMLVGASLSEDERNLYTRLKEYHAITTWYGFKKKYSWDGYSHIITMDDYDAPHWGFFPTDFDASLAPEGYSLLGLSTILHKDKDVIVSEMKETVAELFPSSADDLVFFKVQVDRAEKALQQPDLTMWNMPDQKTTIGGLYVVGTDTQGCGSGGTICADSANRCVRYLMRDLKSRFS